MTVSSTQTRVSYSGNGTTTAFAVPFYFLANTDLVVTLRSSAGIETAQILNTNFTVTGAGVLTGGTVTMFVAPVSGTTLVINRNTPATQTTDLLPNDRLPAESLERALDKATMVSQQLDARTVQALRFPTTDSLSLTSELPNSTIRAGKYVGFDSNGNVTAVSGPATPYEAQNVSFIQSGSGAVIRNVQDRLREFVSIKDFGAVGDGTTDDTTAIQNAVTYAVSSGQKYVYAPPGVYRITSTITVGRVFITGAGQDATIFVAAITNGTPVFKCTNITQAHFEKFMVTAPTVAYGGTFNPTSFRDGLINGQNCIGIEIDSSGGSYARDFTLRDLFMYGLKTGYKIDAFIGLLENCKAWWCETGLIGTLLNTVELNLLFEGNRKDFEVSNSAGVLFRKCMFEGGALQFGLTASTVDDSRAVTFDTLYLEQARNSPFMVFGGSSYVYRVSFTGSIACNNASGTPPLNDFDFDIPCFKFDRVDSLRVECAISDGFYRSLYETTANTKNFFDYSKNPFSNFASVFDNSNNLTSVKNHFPNPNFDLWLRGWPNITLTDASISKETSIVRSGNNALKMTKTVGTTGFSYVIFSFTDGYMASVLAGKTVTLYAWVYIPNLSAYNPNFNSSGVALRTSFPYIAIGTNGTGGTVTYGMTQGGRRGGWNLQRISTTIPSDATTIGVYLTIKTESAAVDEYMIVDSVYLVEGDYSTAHKVQNGWVTDSELIQTSGLVGRMVMRSDSSPTDPDQTFVVGDQVLRLTPTAGGDIGWVCTTGGAGGTAVFKTFATIAA